MERRYRHVVSTRAVHILQFSMTSNHVSCRYRRLPKEQPVDRPVHAERPASASRPPVFIGALSSLDAGDPTEPLTPRRLPRRLGPKALLPDGSSPLSPPSHDRERLPRTRTPSTVETQKWARPTRTVPSASEHRRFSRKGSSDPFASRFRTSWFSPPRASADRHRSTASAAFNEHDPRPHSRLPALPHACVPE